MDYYTAYRSQALDFAAHHVSGRGGPTLAEAVVAALRRDGWALVRGLPPEPDNRPLLRLALGLGSPAAEMGNDHHPLENGLVYRVEERSRPMHSPDGDVVYSTTSSDFAPHTDGYNRKRPFDLVLLHCHQQARTGGESILVHGRDLVARLSAPSQALLATPLLPCAFGLSPMLASARDGGHLVRYNRAALDYGVRCRGWRPEPALLQALEQVDDLLQLGAFVHRFSMRRGDCLVIDNRRVLHGRAAFSSSRRRLLKRLRLYSSIDRVS